MKLFSVGILAAILSTQVQAAESLKCKSTNGSRLEWSETYGELSATDPRGEFIADQDALALGRSRRLGQTKVTDIIFGDEVDYQVFAEIVKSRTSTAIILEGMSFYCR